MTRSTNRRWELSHRPDGKPTEDDFSLIEESRPTPGPKEVLVATRFMSVDPYMRGRMRDRESYADPWDVGDVMQARVVGEVEESNHPRFSQGEYVSGNLEWADYAVADASEIRHVDSELAPLSAYLGVVGMPGRTAYFGLFDVGRPRPGETVVVSAAAGAVGSVVGQLASLTGCTVIGIAGSDEKTEFLTDQLGFDHAINYETENVSSRINSFVNDGVDVYFDNVGGPITDDVLEHLAVRSRVVVCGQIALYNEEDTPTGPRHFWKLIRNRASVEGFLVSDYSTRFDEATTALAHWLTEGSLEYRETITDGLENAPAAFIGLFEGENIGKQLVQISDDE